MKKILSLLLAVLMIVPAFAQVTVFSAETSLSYTKQSTAYTVSNNKYYLATLKKDYNGVKAGTDFFVDSSGNVVTDKLLLNKLGTIDLLNKNGFQLVKFYKDHISGIYNKGTVTSYVECCRKWINNENALDYLGSALVKEIKIMLDTASMDYKEVLDGIFDFTNDSVKSVASAQLALVSSGVVKAAAYANQFNYYAPKVLKYPTQMYDYEQLENCISAIATAMASYKLVVTLLNATIDDICSNGTGLWSGLKVTFKNLTGGVIDAAFSELNDMFLYLDDDTYLYADDIIADFYKAGQINLHKNALSRYEDEYNSITNRFYNLSSLSSEDISVHAKLSQKNIQTSSYSTGTYKPSDRIGLNIRSGASTSYSKVGAIAFGTTFAVTQVNGNWGKTTCNGATGWVCLDYATKVASSGTSGKYNATAAIEYGKKHWNDGKGLCAEFVSNCLEAGGSSAWNVGCTSLVKELKDENWGTLKKLNVNSSGTISLEKNKSILSPGDPIFVYCSGCLSSDGKPYVHVYLCYDTDSNGNLKGYAHNYASNGTIDVYYTCAYCGNHTDAAYVFHIGGSNNAFYDNNEENTSKESYWIDVNGYINGIYKTSLNGYVTFDVYINGSRVKNDFGDFCATYVDGTSYEIRDIKAKPGYTFVSGESLSGKVNGETAYIYISVADEENESNQPVNNSESSNGWSEWSTTKPESKDYRTIESKTQYGYYHYVHKWSDTGFTGAYPVKDYKIFSNDPSDVLKYHEYWSDSKLSDDGRPWKGGGKSYACYPNKCCSLGSNASTAGRYLYDLGKTRTVYRYKDEEPETYTITYNANGGTGAPDEQIKTAGEDIKISSAEPTRKGYEFLGWSTSETGDVKFESGDKYTDDKNITLYAVWNANTYTISYNANGGSGVPSSQTKTHGESIKISVQEPTRDGYEFDGWATTKTGSVSYKAGQQYTSDKDITLYAVWNANTYTISYNANGGTGAPKSQTKEYAESIELSTQEPTRKDYIFLGWSTSAQGSVEFAPGSVCSVNENITLYALWQEEENEVYYIIYNANGGKNAPSMQTKNEDEDITISKVVPTREGYTFDGWAVGDSDAVVYSSGDTYKENKTLYLHAVWTANTYNISYNANGGFGAPHNQTKIHDKSIILSAAEPQKENFIFIGWSDDPDAEYAKYYAEDTFTNNSDTVLYAVWKEIIEKDEDDEETDNDENQSQTDISFEDVPEDAWYRKDVENAYKNGLINGKSEKRYAPNDNMTYAEAIKLACTIYQLYYDGEVTLTNGSDVWYSTYMDYALENRIVRTDYSSVANEYVTRKEFVNIFYGALPLKEFAKINNVEDNTIPDVKIGDAYSGEIYTFYRAGILTGNDAKGTFKPDSNISRSEVAAIVTRMLDSGARKETDF